MATTVTHTPGTFIGGTMSEGTFFKSTYSNITLYIPGCTIKFKNGRFPADPGKLCTNDEEIEAIKGHPLYGKAITCPMEDAQNASDPKAERALLEKAMAKLAQIPGVIPSELKAQSPADQPSQSQAPSLEWSGTLPTLTEVNKMRKTELAEKAKEFGLDVTPGETAGILRRKVRAFLK